MSNTITVDGKFNSKKEIQESKEYKEMDSFSATATAEGFGGFEDPTERQTQAAWQYLYDKGMLHQLQGWFGRTADALMKNRYIYK